MPTKVIVEQPIGSPLPGLYQGSGQPRSIADLDAVGDDALKSYQEDGYLLIRGAVRTEHCIRAAEELQAMTTADDPACDSIFYEGSLRAQLGPGEINATTVAELPLEPRRKMVRKFMGFLAAHPPLAEIATNPPLVAVIEHLAGLPVRIFQDMAMIKPPGGREKPWHQDHAFFNLPLETPVVAAWIALGETTVENGCMFVMPGGHRNGPRLHFSRRDWQICDDEILGSELLAIPMSRGDVLLFDGKLPHGTPPNRTSEFRWSLQFHYIPRGTSEVDQSVCWDAFGGDGKEVTC